MQPLVFAKNGNKGEVVMTSSIYVRVLTCVAIFSNPRKEVGLVRVWFYDMWQEQK